MNLLRAFAVVVLLLQIGTYVQAIPEEIICEGAKAFFVSLRKSLEKQELPNLHDVIKFNCDNNPLFGDICTNLILPNLRYFPTSGKLQIEAIDEVLRNIEEHCGSETMMTEEVEVESIPEIQPCETCVFFMTFLQNEIGDDLSDDNIAHYLNGTCDQFEFGSKDCKRIVTENFDLLADFLKHKISPVEICTLKLDFCSVDFWNEGVAAGGFKCELCEFIIGYIYKKIGNEHNMDKIERVLQNVCNVLPLGKELCREIISHFLPQLKEYLMKKYSPNFICSKIRMCSSLYFERLQLLAANVIVKEYIEANPFEYSPLGSSSECQFCQWVVSAVQSWLSDGHTQTEIALFLNQLCNFFGNYSPQCEQLVKVYVPKLIDSIIEKQTPPLVCSNLGVCKA